MSRLIGIRKDWAADTREYIFCHVYQHRKNENKWQIISREDQEQQQEKCENKIKVKNR